MYIAGINVAGVKWVIRLQLVLLFTIMVAAVDFLVGSFISYDPGKGYLRAIVCGLWVYIQLSASSSDMSVSLGCSVNPIKRSSFGTHS